MHTLFHPQSILVIGVSDSPGNMGRNIVSNLIRYRYRGRVYMMGRKPCNVAGQEVHTSFDTLPHGIDLAVLLTPAQAVPEFMRQCAAHGIGRLVIESGGFTELAEERTELEDQVRRIAAEAGLRFVGPNGLGIITRADGVVLPFMEMPVLPPKGRVSLLAQSGGVGIVYLHALAGENIGLDKFVSMGNKLNLDEVDYLELIGQERSSDVACCYLEDVRRGRQLYEVLRGFPGKVVIQKANVSRAGAAAARSHTASLSTDDRLVEAMVRQSGALRVEDMTSMVHYAMGLTLPPVRGNRLLIVARSGGHAVIAADYAERYGFELPALAGDVADIASSASRAHVIRAANPLDLGDVFDFDRYVAMLDAAVRGDSYDAIALIHVYNSRTEGPDSEGLYRAAARLVREVGKPVFLCFLTDNAELDRLKALEGFPLFRSPEILLQSLAASRRHFLTRERMAVDLFPPRPPMDVAAVAEHLRLGRDEADDAGWLPAERVFQLLLSAGLPVAPFVVARSEEEAVRAASRIGYPVAMKVLSPSLLHKAQGGGVALNVKGDGAAAEEFQSLRQRLSELASGARFDGVLVQGMVRELREVFLGGRQDPSFGPVVTVGLGGSLVEVLNDVTVRLCPVSAGDVDEMLSEVVLFKAFRGDSRQRPADFPFLQECIHRVSNLLVDFPEIAEMDLNPLKLFDEGQAGQFVDGRIRLA